ncbi:DUF721 domain-containing protein [Dethiosulfovibrio sp. F2B]|uniref:DUF721 domain-containing protein n=1 Tax=Dethiosulfovibrio faecalis TaxID=2720018 RepID=UPI001F1A9D41|nr:DUF721 domain-containing protein [Dethiosulfovibrio faecalis]MCF4150994.1 DUF721 domain-containing protein [Dethiosulfovibrio faecalis]
MARRRSRPELLRGLLSGRLPPGLSTALSISEVDKEWSSIVGSVLGRKSRPVSLDRGTLVVACESPGVAKMISMKAGTVASSVEKRWRLGVKSVRAVVARIEAKRDIPESKPARIIPSERSVKACLSYTSDKIDREDVAEALARLMATYMKRFPEKEE